jgi:hypothetical protein
VQCHALDVVPIRCPSFSWDATLSISTVVENNMQLDTFSVPEWMGLFRDEIQLQ